MEGYPDSKPAPPGPIPGLLDSFPRDVTLGELGGILVGKVLGFWEAWMQ